MCSLGHAHPTGPFPRDCLTCGNSILDVPLVLTTYLTAVLSLGIFLKKKYVRGLLTRVTVRSMHAKPKVFFENLKNYQYSGAQQNKGIIK